MMRRRTILTLSACTAVTVFGQLEITRAECRRRPSSVRVRSTAAQNLHRLELYE